MEDRTCECGKTFTPTHWKQAYCCKRHATHAYNARSRGHEPTWDITEAFNCAQCNKHCIPGENVAPNATKFCGAGCKGKWHDREVYYPKTKKATLLASFFVETLRDRTNYKRALRCDPCAYCGVMPSGGVDHIQPTADGGPNDQSNFTGCCQRCNAIKSALPMLHALLWVPVSREYHDMRRDLFH